MKKIGRMRKALKRKFKLTGILMETRIWHVEQRIEYAPLMLYNNKKKSDEKRKIKKMIEDQEKKNYKKLQQIAETLEIE